MEKGKPSKTNAEVSYNSRDLLDRSLLSLSSAFIGLIFGFLKDIHSLIGDDILLKFLFLLIVALLVTSISFNLYSHHYVASVTRRLQLQPQTKNYLWRIEKIINLMNCCYLWSFLIANLVMFIFIVRYIFH